jgi:hypothetical protein
MDTLSHFAGQDIFKLMPQTDVNEFISFLNGEPVNQIPTVLAGTPTSLALGDTLWLNGQVSDDGLPSNGSLNIQWTAISGPAGVILGDSQAASTFALFSQTGSYQLELFASDGRSYDRDTTMITVTSPLNIPWKDVRVEVDHNQCRAHLCWENPEAEEVAYFEILESIDGQEFTSIGQVDWKSNQERIHFYALLPALTTYFQIKAWNASDLLSTSSVLTARCRPDDTQIQVYPNPIREGILQIRVFEPHNSLLHWNLLDLQGKRMMKWTSTVKTGENILTEPVNGLAPGLYILRLEGESIRTWKVLIK